MADSEPEEGEISEENVNKPLILPQKRPASPKNYENKPSYENKPYKKLPCKYFAAGTCQRGDRCTYIHDAPIKTDICKYFLNNTCIRGENC